jgi:hypothetical protein
LKLVASPQGEGDAVKIHADAALYSGLFDGAEQAASLALNPGTQSLCAFDSRRAATSTAQALQGWRRCLLKAEIASSPGRTARTPRCWFLTWQP